MGQGGAVKARLKAKPCFPFSGVIGVLPAREASGSSKLCYESICCVRYTAVDVARVRIKAGNGASLLVRVEDPQCQAKIC